MKVGGGEEEEGEMRVCCWWVPQCFYTVRFSSGFDVLSIYFFPVFVSCVITIYSFFLTISK